MKPKINKLFLFVRGGGRWGVSASGLSPLPLPPAGSLSRNARRKPAPAPAPPRAPTTPKDGTCAIDTPHTDRASAPPIEVRSAGVNGRGAAPLRSWVYHPPTPAHARNPNQGGAAGEEGWAAWAKLPAPNPSPRPNPEKESQRTGEWRWEKGFHTLRVRGWELPLPPEKLSHWLLLLPRTHPPSHLSLFHLPTTFHSSGSLSDRPGKLVGNGAGRQKPEKAPCKQV